MKKLVFIFILFASLQITYAQKSDRPDPVPQTSKPTPIYRDTLPEERLWQTIAGKIEHIELDSTNGSVIRRIAIFEGVKMQFRRGTGNLFTVNAWEYRYIKNQHGLLALYIFKLDNGKKEIVSLRPIQNGYKKIIFLISANGLETQKLEVYIPDNLNNKEVTKEEIKF